MKHMKQMTWAIVAIAILVAGSILPAEARGGRGGGFHGGRSHGGSFRGHHGFHKGGFRGGHGFHGSRFHGGTRVFIGSSVGWWGWPGWWRAPYPYYSYAAPVVIQPAPTTYIQQEAAPPAQDYYWYYCANARAYYPYVKDCPGGWMQVVPAPTSPGP